MKPVFSCSFDIAQNGRSSSEVFAQAAQIARTWIEGKYARPSSRYGFGHVITVPTPGRLEPLPGHLLLTEDAGTGVMSLRDIIWEHPGDEPNEFWRTELCLAHDGSKAGITLHTSIGSRLYSLTPLNFQPGVPGIVSKLMESLSCTLGGWRMPDKFFLVPHGAVGAFVNQFLLNPSRTLPIIVISRDVWTEGLPVKPEIWARALAGLAEVAVLENKWAGFQLTEHLGRPLSCFGGAIRIYWPRLTLNSNPEKHRLWLPHEVEAAERSSHPLHRRLVAFLAAISTTNHVESSLVSTVRRGVEQAKLDAHAAAIAKLTTVDASSETQEIVNAYSSENKELKAQLEKSRAELVEERQVSANLRAEITNHQENYLLFQQSVPTPLAVAATPTAAQSPSADFESVLDAYNRAEKEFGGLGSPLVFLESARKSASESPYQSPEQVYFLIKELYSLAQRWRDGKGKLGQDWYAALLPTGFEFKPHISGTTKGKFGDEYYFVYDGRSVLFKEHVTKGAKNKNACFSLHMYRDEQKLLVAIGHCGNHLTNTSS